MAMKDGVELVKRFEKACKAAEEFGNGKQEAEEVRCVEALMSMKSFSVTTSILVETQVAKRLHRLTKHSSPRISTQAREVLNTWKKVVAEATVQNEKRSSVSKTPLRGTRPTKNSTTLEATSSPPRSLSTHVEKVITVSATRSPTPTGLSATPANGISADLKIPKTGDITRDRFRQLLQDAFTKVLSEVEGKHGEEVRMTDLVDAVVRVESALFRKMGVAKDANRIKYRSIMFNLKDPKNPDFRRRVLLGEVDPEQLSSMSAEEMASNSRKAENQKIKAKALFECERGFKVDASTDQFMCEKCKQRKCTYFQMQTRSADEPMTTFVTCLNCNHRWKFC